MRYAKVRTMDISNGPGIRVSLFVSGCRFNCKGCFNREFQDFEYGNNWNEEAIEKFVELGNMEHIDGYSILGGEPLMQDDMILKTVKRIKEKSNKSIWMWTGFKFENLSERQLEIIRYVDVLVDGQFIEKLRNPSLRFRGSSNQRIIDVHDTLKSGSIRVIEL